MKADPGQQAKLLDLQALDTRLSQIAHARTTLPQLAEIADLQGKASLLDDQLVRSRTELGDVQRELTKADSDVQQVRDRTTRNQQRLDSGVGTAKDLTAIQHELVSLGRRQSDLEEVELEVMERVEAIQSDVAELERGRGEITDRLTALESDRDARLAELAADEVQVSAPREELVSSVGVELLALYDKIRATSGTGAAALRQRRCGGCQLELNPVALRDIKAAPQDEVHRCEECRRILVRTAESGL
ncbi:MAG: C4-type zinc ribbon domain-containing protein [Knoellia sp.]